MASTAIKVVTSFPDPQEKVYDQQNWYNDHQNASVVINCQANNIYYPLHWTPLSLKTVVTGSENYLIDGRKYTVDQNNFLILNEGTWYESFIHDHSAESLTINFNREAQLAAINLMMATPADLLDTSMDLPITFPEFMLRLYPKTPQFTKRLDQLRQWINLKQIDLSAEEEVHYILADLMHLSNETSQEVDRIIAKKRSTREELYRRLHIVKDFIYCNYAQAISLDVLARTSFLNSFYLLRAFKGLFGISPGQYLIQRRMEVAHHLVLHTQRSVNTICYEVGYQDISSFSKLYKDLYGLAPLQDRKNNTHKLLIE